LQIFVSEVTILSQYRDVCISIVVVVLVVVVVVVVVMVVKTCP